LSQVSSTAPFHSSVSSHDEVAKRQEARRLDKGGEHVWIPFSGSVREHAPPRFETVELSITTPWSNGPIEGHINRLKAIKRQMYGRAGLDLLKARVLPWGLEHAA
jgi:hypothetical protein